MAKQYAQIGYVHCEADQYFEVGGEYRFDPAKLRAAHDDCLRRAVAALDAGRSVVVANTFTRRWEMEPYLRAAKRRGIDVRVIEVTWKVAERAWCTGGRYRTNAGPLGAY